MVTGQSRTRRYARPLIAVFALIGADRALAQNSVPQAAGNSTASLAPIAVEGNSMFITPRGPVGSYVAERSVAATKTDIPLIESPPSIAVIGREQLEDRNADTLT